MVETSVESAIARAGDRMAALDLLRFAAALGVVGFHYLFRGAAEAGLLDRSYGQAGEFARFGYLGVNLFFMISGFVIIWSASGRDWYSFAIGRVTRLYPAHLVAMTLTAVLLALWATPPLSASGDQWLANLTMLAPVFGQPFMGGAYWSIVVEIIFYGWVAVGLVTGLLPRRTDVFVAGWITVLLVNTLLIDSHALAVLFITPYAACFCLGIMAWRVTADGVSPFRTLLILAALGSTFLTAERQRLDMIHDYGETIPILAAVLANAVVTAVFLATVFSARRLRPAGWMLSLGGISYPLYLIHQNAGYVIINAAAPVIGRWPAALLAGLVALGVAWFIWRWCEPPGQRLVRALLTPLGRFCREQGRPRAR
ncbi:peptidoglycan/LPS O-acetylase OafA/YrhL [Hoeflea marina]|uniref:Peptidoglycan/LPS O-acetylase OafA/YrhL n=1 Tax=Hoeflea marina TaxID=274592 RepID=A0A317PT45_9HYPH|nr:acyltransferase [Hoeflea marina]PWW04097.1 peptidoglycan/LPS O-acetylase OafA/YrhL [Hoeflea marina]